MKQAIINILFYFTHYFGISKLFRFIFRNKASIIVYHDPSPKVFEQHLKYLKEHYNIISLSELVLALKSKNDLPLPKNSIIITIDDGHKNNYYLLPIIKKYKVIPTIYLTSDIICTNKKFWWLIPQSAKEIENIKSLSNYEKNRVLSEKYNFSLDEEFLNEERCALNKKEILEMNPFVDFQSHTCHHPILTKCTEEELNDELLLSKKKLEILLSKNISHMSYPNGDYDSNIMSKVKALGYLSARTTKCGLVGEKSDLFKLKIVGVSESNIKHRFELDLLGIPLLIINFQRKLKHKFNKITSKLI